MQTIIKGILTVSENIHNDIKARNGETVTLVYMGKYFGNGNYYRIAGEKHVYYLENGIDFKQVNI